MTTDSSVGKTKSLWIAIIAMLVIILSTLAFDRSSPGPSSQRFGCCPLDGGGLGHWRDATKRVCEGSCFGFTDEGGGVLSANTGALVGVTASGDNAGCGQGGEGVSFASRRRLSIGAAEAADQPLHAELEVGTGSSAALPPFTATSH